MRVNWIRSSRSAAARRCSTAQSDLEVESSDERAREGTGGFRDRSLLGVMAIISIAGELIPEVTNLLC
jgi:hypothetical protein